MNCIYFLRLSTQLRAMALKRNSGFEVYDHAELLTPINRHFTANNVTNMLCQTRQNITLACLRADKNQL